MGEGCPSAKWSREVNLQAVISRIPQSLWMDDLGRGRPICQVTGSFDYVVT